MAGILEGAPGPLKGFEIFRAYLYSAVFDTEQNLNKTMIQGFALAYERLEVLILCLAYGNYDWDVASTETLENLSKILAKTTRLRELEIHLPNYSREYIDEHEPRYDIEEVFPMDALGWHDLRSFSITNLTTDPAHLMRFQMPNLASLYFEKVELNKGYWPTFVECMSHHLKLSRFETKRYCCLVYPDGMSWWPRGIPELIYQMDDFCTSTEDELHQTFMLNVERCVVRGGRHPFLQDNQPDDSLFGGSDKLFSEARILAKHSSVA